MPRQCQLEMAKYAAGQAKQPVHRKVLHMKRIMMLLNPPMRLNDLISNLSHALILPIEQAPAAGLDRFVLSPVVAAAANRAARRQGRSGTVTGRQVRTRVFHASDVAVGSWEGAKKGAADAMEVLRGNDPRVMERTLDSMANDVHYDNPLAEGVSQGVLRSMGAADAAFQGIAFGRALREQARILGMRQGLRDADLDAFVAWRTQTPTDEMVAQAAEDLALLPSRAEYERWGPAGPTREMLERAGEDAKVSTFADETAPAGTLMRAKNWAREVGPAAEAVGELIVPFARVPSNVAWRIYEHTPAGFVHALYNFGRAVHAATRGDLTPAMRYQRYAADQFSRATLGGFVIFGSYLLAKSGRLNVSGLYPTAPGERGQMEVTGEQAAAIRVGDEWLSIDKLQPLAALMMIGAHIAEEERATGDSTPWYDPRQAFDVALGAPVTGIPFAADQPAFQAAELAVENLRAAREENDDAAERFASGVVSSFVPSPVAQIARYTDRSEEGNIIERETRGAGILGRLQSRIPGWRRALPYKVDPIGRRVEYEARGLKGFADNFLHPLQPRASRVGTDTVAREIERLDVPITARKADAWETREQYLFRREVEGTWLRWQLEAEVTGNAEVKVDGQWRLYSGFTDAEKRELMGDRIQSIRGTVTRERKGAYEEGMEEVAYAMGQQQGLTYEALDDFVKRAMRSPTPEMRRRGGEYYDAWLAGSAAHFGITPPDFYTRSLGKAQPVVEPED